MPDTHRYTLTISCPDRAGIIAAVSGFIAQHGGFIVEASYHTEQEAQRFFMRQEIRADSLPFDADEFRRRFAPLAQEFGMNWQLSDSAIKKRLVILVSKQDHCLDDLLHRWRSGELQVDIPCVISNHEDLRSFVEWHGIPFVHVDMQEQGRRVRTDRRAVRAVSRRQHGAGALHADPAARAVPAFPGAHHQHPPQLPALLRRCEALSPGLSARRETDRRDLPLRDRRTGCRAYHRAGHGAHRPRRHGGRSGALRARHREDGAVARPALPRGRPRAGVRQQDHRVQVTECTAESFPSALVGLAVSFH